MEHYQAATSYIKTAALLSCVVSGVLGDLLVVEWDISLRVLMWISGVFVWSGFLVGLYVIRASKSSSETIKNIEKVENDNTFNRDTDASAGTASTLDNIKQPSDEGEGHRNSEVIFFKDSPFVHSRSHSKNRFKTSDEINLLGTPHISRNSNSLEKSAFVKKVFNGENKSTNFSEKIRIFKMQLNYLNNALQSFAFSTMLILWIVGNAIFSVRNIWPISYLTLSFANDFSYL